MKCGNLHPHIITISFLLKFSTLIIVDESPVTHCWTSYQATSPCCIAGSHQLVAPREEATPEAGAPRLAVGNGLRAPSADKRRDRGVRRSRDPSADWLCPWLRNADSSRTGFIILVPIVWLFTIQIKQISSKVFDCESPHLKGVMVINNVFDLLVHSV